MTRLHSLRVIISPGWAPRAKAIPSWTAKVIGVIARRGAADARLVGRQEGNLGDRYCGRIRFMNSAMARVQASVSRPTPSGKA